jgi:hypothetical protein
MTWRYGERREGRVFTGVVFLIIGIVLLLGNLNVLEIRPLLSQWWPLILVIVGIKHLLNLRGTTAWLGGLFWIGTGALFLASTLGYIHIAITSVIWPLMLIWFGVLVVVGGNGCGKTSIRDGSEM